MAEETTTEVVGRDVAEESASGFVGWGISEMIIVEGMVGVGMEGMVGVGEVVMTWVVG